jgi:hypothetical protein
VGNQSAKVDSKNDIPFRGEVGLSSIFYFTNSGCGFHVLHSVHPISFSRNKVQCLSVHRYFYSEVVADLALPLVFLFPNRFRPRRRRTIAWSAFRIIFLMENPYFSSASFGSALSSPHKLAVVSVGAVACTASVTTREVKRKQ